MQDTMMIEVQDPFGNTLGEDQLRSSKVDKHEFLLPENYVVNEVLGKGAYGVVVSAYDEKKKKEVAIKKNCDIFTRNGNTLIPLRVLRELWILSHLSHPNLISLEDVVKPPSYETFNDLYLVTGKY
jgi:mitogen-activated protein kinase 1/3